MPPTVRTAAATSQSKKGSRLVPHPPHAPSAQQQLQEQQSLLFAATAIPAGASLEPVLRIINEPSTARQYERQMAALIQCLDDFKVGFSPAVCIDGVPQVIGFLVNALNNEIGLGSEDEKNVVPGLSLLLERCASPIVCMTLGDQRKHDEALTLLLEGVASALLAPQSSVRITAATVLRKMVAYIRQQCHDDVHAAPAVIGHKRKEHRRCITETVISSVIDAWRGAVNGEHVDPAAGNEDRSGTPVDPEAAPGGSDDEEEGGQAAAAAATTSTLAETVRGPAHAEVTAMTRAVLELSYFRNLCEQMSERGVIDIACEALQRAPAGDRQLSLCVDILWNTMSLFPGSTDLVTRDHVDTLYVAFVHTLQLGYKLKDRELRNDMIVVMHLIASNPQNVQYFDSLVELLIDLSCGPEMSHADNELIPAKFHYTTNPVELQCKMLCWKLIDALCVKTNFAEAIISLGFMDVLLCYINVHCEIPAVVQWSTLQLLDLQTNALHILVNLSVIGYDQFSGSSGAAIVHEYIAECPDLKLRNLGVSVLARVAATPTRSDLVEAGAIPLALQLLQEGTDNHSLLVECLNMLADTVDRDPDLQRTFLDCDGVSVVLPLLTLTPTFHTDLLDTVIFAAVDCVWSCVFGNEESEAAFVVLDGIHALLRVLETVPRWMTPFPLSCLADILQNPNAVEEFRGWTSDKTRRSGVQVLLSLWDSKAEEDGDEDEQVAGTAGSAGEVRSAKVRSGLSTLGTAANYKLNSQPAKDPTPVEEGEEEENEEADESCGGPDGPKGGIDRVGLDEIPEDIRPLAEANEINFKIYATLSLVGFDDHKELGPTERGQLATVEAFVDLCRDEIWGLVEKSLEEDGVTAIPADAEKLRLLREAAQARAEELRSTRLGRKREEQAIVSDAEATFYKSLIKKTNEGKTQGGKNGAVKLSITEAKKRKAAMLKQSFKQALGRQKSVSDQNGGDQDGTEEGRAAEDDARRAAEEEEERLRTERWGLGQKAMSSVEYSLLQALNKVRTDPESLIPHLKEKLSYINAEGNAFNIPGRDPEHCVEGTSAINEAIDFLQAVRPLVTLLDVPLGMLHASRDHVADLSRTMEVLEDGTDGSTPLQRMQRYGKPSNTAIQMLSMGQTEAIDVVTQLIVDDGVTNRIDRKTIFDPDMRQCGIGVGVHAIHQHFAVILLAHDYTDKPQADQEEIHQQYGGAKRHPDVE